MKMAVLLLVGFVTSVAAAPREVEVPLDSNSFYTTCDGKLILVVTVKNGQCVRGAAVRDPVTRKMTHYPFAGKQRIIRTPHPTGDEVSAVPWEASK